MSARIPLRELTQQDLDGLYNDLAEYEENEERVIGDLNEANTGLARQAAQAEAALSDMARDRDRQKWYADENDRKRKVQRTRAEQAENAIARVRKATANSFMAGPNAVDVVRVADVLAALAEPEED